ncbi:phosphatidic acid-binding protein CHM7 [Lachancea thermotolerans CBS 6340]|uniref:KLTH0H10362p n=1 Tax=Lachancea thermotolerans (strain ATCC 56472 / CBS 6340 / NRRL Y-8284) TaxID=559295 RepID=C5E348_LACTC|nr:KLTH0H10362p [Lachancea thermotolerans CBS 6340]CAR30459.1 KLTH0H10362p [Lachancea thermotolerans CBS 6340]
MRDTTLSKSRLTSLYSDFRKLKDLNPEGYEANVRYWRHLLLDEVFSDKLICQCGSELLKELSDKELGPPKCLDTALDSLISDGLLIAKERFKRNNNSKILKAFSWTIGYILAGRSQATTRTSEGANYLRDADFVVLPTTKRKSLQAEQRMRSSICKKAIRYSDLIFSKLEFCKIVGMEENLQGWNEFEIVLMYMETYMGVIVTDCNTVKVCTRDMAPLLAKFDFNFISENDRNIASVKETYSILQFQVSMLEDRIRERKQVLAECIKSDKPKDLQRLHLRAKKLLERNLTTACRNLQNIETLKSDIEMSLDNVNLRNTLLASRDVMSNVSAELGDTESVEKLLDEISLERSKNEEISDILAGKLDDQNDEQLNEELEELDAEVKKEQEVTRELSKLKISSYQGFGPEEVALVAGRESPVEEESRADLGPSESKNKEPILST